MEGLTKENFFNELHAKYPKGLQVFCDWIDEHKKKNNWNELFNVDIITHPGNYPLTKSITTHPKFHDLPYAMQLGIILQFMQEHSGNPEETIDMREMIVGYISNLHNQLNEEEVLKARSAPLSNGR